MQPERKFIVTYGVTTKEVFPYNGNVLKYVWEKERDQIFKRKKLSGELIFINNSIDSIDDFDFFKTIEFSGNMCQRIYIEIKRLCHNEYVSEWKGYFSTGSGKFNLDKCTFQVTPQVNDKYSCILDNWEIEFNMFDYTLQTFYPSGDIEYNELTGNKVAGANCDGLVDCATAGTNYAYFSPDYSSAADMTTKKWCVKTHTVGSPTTYVRLKVTRIPPLFCGFCGFNFLVGQNIAGQYGGTGTICAIQPIDVNNQYLIVKNVLGTFNGQIYCTSGCTYGSTRGDLTGTDTYDYCPVTTVWESQTVLLACSLGVCAATPPGHFMYENNCATTGFCKFRRCPSTSLGQDYRGVFYTEMINGESEKHCELPLTSIFFDYSPDTENSHYEAGVNYVTGLAQLLKNIIISQQSDIIYPNATNPATIGMLSLKKMLDWAREVYNCYWDIVNIDGDDYLRVEHFSFYDKYVVLDLTQEKFLKYIDFSNSYEHTSEEIPQLEKWTWSAAGGLDFIGVDIIYQPPCAKPGANVEHVPEELTTDHSFVAFNTSLSNDGFVMTHVDLIGSDYILHAEEGILSGFVLDNAHLSWANLHHNYHMHNRYLQFGNMNNTDTTFISWVQNIRQVELNIVLCCDEIIDAEGYVRTPLGDILDDVGLISRMEQTFKNDVVKLVLLYSF